MCSALGVPGLISHAQGNPQAEHLVCKPLYLPICIFDVILMCGPHIHKPLMLQLWEDLVQSRNALLRQRNEI